jgi:peptidyl-prolyl cis-trans isomerase SurA
VLEGKLVNQLVQERVRITEQELSAAFDSTVEKERRVRLYRPAWVVLRVGKKPSDAVMAKRKQLAEDIAQRARAGTDFGDLAVQYSQDPSTSASGGDLGIRAPAGSPAAARRKHRRLATKLERVAMSLEPGEVSEPFRFKEGLVVMKLISRQPSRYTTLEAAKGEMLQRIRAQKMEKAKKKWLKDLRRRTHVDVRL